MWEKIIFILIAAECLLLLGFIVEWARKKKSDLTVLFLVLAFIVNLTLNLIPYLYGVLVESAESNYILDALDCVTNAIRSFVGEGDSEAAKAFAASFPAFSLAYLLGVVLALLATVNAALQAFSYTLRNRFRLFFALRGKSCDIVLGTGENALRYARDGAAVLIPENHIDKDGALRLMERGYIVLRRSFSKELLAGRVLKRFTDYNIICPGKTEENLDHIDTFIAYRKAGKRCKRIRLFVEIEGAKAKTIRREIIDKSCCKDAITTFCSNELLARQFAEEHPITEYMPRSFLEEDTSLRGDVALHVMYLGFGPLNREMYRQSVLNNQLVTYDGQEYIPYPISYHLYDQGIDRKDWLIDGLKEALEKKKAEQARYFPLQPLPYQTQVQECIPHSKETLEAVAEQILSGGKDAFYTVIVDVGDTYQNIEAAARLRSLLGSKEEYHIYIRSESVYSEEDARITYLGDIDDIFHHDIIVNDGLLRIAYQLNELYTIRKERRKKGEALDLRQLREDAEAEWKEMSHFVRYSNLYAALNLRLKLQLLGLDYVREARGEAFDAQNLALIDRCYPCGKEPHVYEQYPLRCLRNAIRAQEKYRWNIYHLAEEILPRPIEAVVAQKKTEQELEKERKKAALRSKKRRWGKRAPAACWEPELWKLTTKDDPLTTHACITTYSGLHLLSTHLMEQKSAATGIPQEIEWFDYFQNDDQLLCTVTELMKELNYTIVERKE